MSTYPQMNVGLFLGGKAMEDGDRQMIREKSPSGFVGCHGGLRYNHVTVTYPLKFDRSHGHFCHSLCPHISCQPTRKLSNNAQISQKYEFKTLPK